MFFQAVRSELDSSAVFAESYSELSLTFSLSVFRAMKSELDVLCYQCSEC